MAFGALPFTNITQKEGIYKRNFSLPHGALDTCFLTPRLALPFTNVSQKEGIYTRNFRLVWDGLYTLFLTPRFSNANK